MVLGPRKILHESQYQYLYFDVPEENKNRHFEKDIDIFDITLDNYSNFCNCTIYIDRFCICAGALWTDYNFIGGDMVDGGSNVTNLTECQLICQTTTGCLFYVWAPSDSFNCQLKSDIPDHVEVSAGKTTGATNCKRKLQNK